MPLVEELEVDLSGGDTSSKFLLACWSMALVLLFEDLVLRSVEPFELPGDEFVRAVTSASKTVKEKKKE